MPSVIDLPELGEVCDINIIGYNTTILALYRINLTIDSTIGRGLLSALFLLILH